jgi:hypothetical protein
MVDLEAAPEFRTVGYSSIAESRVQNHLLAATYSVSSTDYVHNVKYHAIRS